MGKRILAFFVDYIALAFLLSLIGLVEVAVESLGNPILIALYSLVIWVITIAFFFKDIVGGQSLGKRFVRIKVVGKDGNTPKMSKLILRNITLLIFPIEAILVIFEKKRLGDRLAVTDVIELVD